MREAGLPVEIEIEGEPRELPPGVDLSAYRIIQEALTNALRYAGPAHAWVTVRWKDRELELEIANDGRSEPGREGVGHGLAGLRERVALVGGSIESGPRSGGGYIVRAHLPLRGSRVTTRVLIADDQALVRDGFRMILEAEEGFEVVGEAADGLEAVLAARETTPDVILMDVRMPNVDGLEATRKLLERDDTGARVLILTTFDLDEYVYEALRAGASGFLLKDTPPEQLVEAIRVVAQGDELLAPSVTCRIVAEFVRPAGGQIEPSLALDELAPDELELLRQVASGLSNAEIAAEKGVEEASVRADVSQILAVLQLRDRVHAVVFAHERGLLAPEECADD